MSENDVSEGMSENDTADIDDANVDDVDDDGERSSVSDRVGLQASPLHLLGELKGLVSLLTLLKCTDAAMGNVPKLLSLPSLGEM